MTKKREASTISTGIWQVSFDPAMPRQLKVQAFDDRNSAWGDPSIVLFKTEHDANLMMLLLESMRD